MRTAVMFTFAVLVAACSGSSNPAPGVNQTSSTAATPAVALAVVFDGHEVWVGNEEHESDPAAQYPGALNGLRAALAEQPPGSVLPAGSQVVVVSYSVGAKIRSPLGPIEELSVDALGKQADYKDQLSSDLVHGVELGLAELAKATAPRHVLVVIGDGNDTNNEAARPALEAIRSSSKAEIYAIVYKSSVSDESDILAALTSNATPITSPDGFRAALADVWRRVAGG